MATSEVLVVGSANCDLVFQTPALPRPGETLLGGQFSTHPGGKGANQAMAIARLGGRVAFAGAVGRDLFGDGLIESLRGAGVDLRFLRQRDGVATGTAAILVDAHGQNSIVVAPGANNSVTADQVGVAVDTTAAGVTLAQLEIPMAAVQEAANRARVFILNPAPARPLPPELLAKVTVLTPNESECEALTGVAPNDLESCQRAAGMLRDQGVVSVVITLGERGVFASGPDYEEMIPAFPVAVVDTTAAGDAFSGALALFLSRRKAPEVAIRWASAVAALAVTRPGAQESMPTMSEVALAFPGLPSL